MEAATKSKQVRFSKLGCVLPPKNDKTALEATLTQLGGLAYENWPKQSGDPETTLLDLISRTRSSPALATYIDAVSLFSITHMESMPNHYLALLDLFGELPVKSRLKTFEVTILTIERLAFAIANDDLIAALPSFLNSKRKGPNFFDFDVSPKSKKQISNLKPTKGMRKPNDRRKLARALSMLASANFYLFDESESSEVPVYEQYRDLFNYSPFHLSLLQALKQSLRSFLQEWTNEERSVGTICSQLVKTVPALKAKKIATAIAEDVGQFANLSPSAIQSIKRNIANSINVGSIPHSGKRKR